MSIPDKRPEAEIQVGAAFNAVDALQSDLDDLLAGAMKDTDTPPDTLCELASARHHVYQARICVARVFGHIKRKRSLYLGSIRSLNDGHAAMKQAREHSQLMIGNIESNSIQTSSLPKMFNSTAALATEWTERKSSKAASRSI